MSGGSTIGIGSITRNESSSRDSQRQRGGRRRGSVRKAQQDYLDCLEALSATRVSSEDKSFSQAVTFHQKEPPPRRSVSFATKCTGYQYDYSPTDDVLDLKLSGKIWYTEEDEENFKGQARRDVEAFKRLQKGGEETDGCVQRNLCLVGLEQHLVSPDYTKKRARTKKLITYAVLGAQSRGVGKNDPERIAKTAQRYSEWSVEQAKKFGDFQHIQSKE